MAGIPLTGQQTELGNVNRKGNFPALISLAVLYFMLGFITCLNDTLVPFFKEGFTLTYAESSLVQFYFFLVYGLFSIPIGRVIEKIGYVKGMIAGFLFAAAGSLIFLPSAWFHTYSLFLAALFIVAIGIVFMQVSANPFIILLGSPKTASARLNLIQSVGSIGTIAAPIFGAAVILSKTNQKGTTNAVVLPYTGIAIFLLVLSLIILKLRLPDVRTVVDLQSSNDPKEYGRSLFSYRNLNLGALGIFFFVGIEIAVGSFLTNYIADVLHISKDSANRYVAFYWGGMLVGRLVGVFLLKYIKPSRLLIVNSVCAIILIIVSVNSNGMLAVWSMIMVGLFNSVLFANIFSLSISGLGRHVTRASGILSAAISGGGFIVIFQGFLIDRFSWQIAFVTPVLCYIYIIFYGLEGYKSKYNHSVRIL